MLLAIGAVLIAPRVVVKRFSRISKMPINFASGRYGVGGASRPVTNAVKQTIEHLLSQGMGVTQIRAQRAARGLKISNNALTGVVKEYKAVGAKISKAKFIGNSRRPTSKTIVQSGMKFGTKYQYHGIIHLRQRSECRQPGDEIYREDMPTYFGDDRKLTGIEIREKLESIGEKIAKRGGTGKGGRKYLDCVYVHHVTIRPIVRSR
jgi:hypothetical protein